jgi:hypothetical protein
VTPPKNSLLTRRGFTTKVFAAASTLLGSTTIFTATGAQGASTTKRRRKATTTKRRTTKANVAKTSSPTTVKSGDATGTFAATQELIVTWTYTAVDGGGRIHNPYVAVWVEDADGVPVRIVHFEYQLERGRKWLKDMKRWYRVDEIMVALGKPSTADTTTQATRLPGTYSVAWDGRNADGDLVPYGTYTVFVEAAREKGPYQYVKTAITLGAVPVSKKGEPTGDLTSIDIELKTKP